jgi:hypothetical protein
LGNDDGLRKGGEMLAGDPRGTTKQTKAHEQTPVHLRTPHQPLQVVADEVGADAKSQLPGASDQGGSGGWGRGTYESTELCDAGNTEHSTEQAKQCPLHWRRDPSWLCGRRTADEEDHQREFGLAIVIARGQEDSGQKVGLGWEGQRQAGRKREKHLRLH